MKRVLTLLLLAIMLIGLALPSAAQVPQPADAVVNTPFLNMRVAPDPTSARIAVLPAGTPMRLVARDAAGRWVQGVLNTGVSGWVNASFLLVFVNINALPIGIPSQVVPPPPLTGLATVNTGAQNVRSGPGANFSIIDRLRRGDVVTLVGRNGDARWVQVVTSSGVNGWMSARYLLPNIAIVNLPVTNPTGVTPGFVEPVPSGGTAGIVTASALNVRLGPGVHFRSIARLTRGTGVNLSGRNVAGNWLLVQLADGRTGWVNASFISTGFPISSLPVRG